jgi:hypothetical protein
MDTLNTFTATPQLVLFPGQASPEQLQSACTELPVPFEMLALFEAISGWVVKYRESPFFERRIASDKGSGLCLKGDFSTVDMTAEWPARRPTASRIKCDQFLKLLSDVVWRSQSLEAEVNRLQQFLTAQSACDNHEICDSFVPRHPYQTQSELHSDFILSVEPDAKKTPGSELTNDRYHNTESTFSADRVEASCTIPKWQIGGRRGFHENRYIDWAIRNDHRIELIMGQIDQPENPDSQWEEQWETKLTVNPETSRFWFSVEPRGGYWLLDQATSCLNRISDVSKISQLEPNQALVFTTAELGVNDLIKLSFENGAIFSQNGQNADDLASAMQDYLQTDEPLLVLLRQ